MLEAAGAAVRTGDAPPARCGSRRAPAGRGAELLLTLPFLSAFSPAPRMSRADGINFRRAAIRRKSTPGLGPIPYRAAPTLLAGAPQGEPARSLPTGNDGFGRSAGEGWGRRGNVAARDERMAFIKSCQPSGCGRRGTHNRARPAPGPPPSPRGGCEACRAPQSVRTVRWSAEVGCASPRP